MKLGIIGVSDGNGHPYSWSAIINGYDEHKMNECGYESIPIYLKENSEKLKKIDGVEVSHVWTQMRSETKKIAEATYIKNQCIHWNEMIDRVDGLLLARDDSENHMRYAESFLRKGIPVYIDKPIATTKSQAEKIYKLEKYPGQIFTCSALRYADEFNLNNATRKDIGKIKRIEAISIKDWDKYAVHIIEPCLNIAKPNGKVLRKKLDIAKGKTRLELIYEDIEMAFETTGTKEGKIAITIFGTHKTITREFKDPFEAFKKSLEMFVDGIWSKKQIISRDEVTRVVEIIELGRQNESQRDWCDSGKEYL